MMPTTTPEVLVPEAPVDDQAPAADAAHLANVVRMYEEMLAIDDERSRLRQREEDLRQRIIEAVGVTPGQIIEQRGERFQVIRPYGEFEFSPDGDRIVAAVRCSVAPATSSGFHARKTVVRTVFDKQWFPSPHVQAASVDDEPGEVMHGG